MVSGRTRYSQALGAFDQAGILALGGKLAPSLQIMRLLARLGERGDPASANRLLGAPTTTVEDWCRAQLPLSSVNGAQA